MDRKYAEYATQKAAEIIAIDSPTGYTKKAAEWVKNEFEALGFEEMASELASRAKEIYERS